LLLIMFFSKGLDDPFASLSEKIFSFKLMYIFRDFKDKFAIAFSLILSILSMYFVSGHKWFRTILTVIVIGSLISFASTQWLSKSFFYSDNLNYLLSAQFSDNSVSRILSLPLANYSFFYTKDPAYFGDSPLKNLFKREVMYTTSLQVGAVQSLKDALDSGGVSEVEFYAFLREHNIQYVLNHKNSYVKEDNDPFSYDYHILSHFSFLHLQQDTTHFQVYEFKDFYPRVIGSEVSFKRNSPVEYHVYISHLSNTEVALLDSYNPGWKIWLVEDPSSDWCEKYTVYTPVKTVECKSNYGRENMNIFPSEKLIPAIWLDSYISTETHGSSTSSFLLQAPLNTWQLKASAVTGKLPTSYYIRNEDGTIDVEAFIYFEPQLYFLYGLAISIFSAVLLVIFLIFYWNVGKRDNEIASASVRERE